MATKDLIPQAEVVIAAKRQMLQERKSRTPIEAVRALASMQKRPLPVLNSVGEESRVMLIGQINYSPTNKVGDGNNYDPVGTALRYVKAGVDAIALFTDETLYHGGLDDLVLVSRAVQHLPVISQDYIFDEYQIVEARAAGASALVLSSAVLDSATLRSLVSSTQRNRMTAIVEVYSPDELEYALSLSPYVIGITDRDPLTNDLLEDQINLLRPMFPPNARVMVMDVLTTLDEVERIIELGVNAILVKETILDHPDQVAELHRLIEQPHLKQ